MVPIQDVVNEHINSGEISGSGKSPNYETSFRYSFIG